MAYFQNDDLEYVVNDYYGDVVEFEEDNDAFADNQPRPSLEVVDDDSDDLKTTLIRFQDSSYCNRETPKSLPSLSPFQCRGPQCVFSCANEYRSLPKQKFTCCLALDGVNVLASGFEADEKVKIKNLVTSMGGVLHTKTSLDVSFVIVKNVLAAKYKWAVNTLKKPVLTINWLYQCCNEHRIVPQESFRVLPVSGLTICVTRIPSDERKKIENLITENGGHYSAELTRKCTHLICDAPVG